MTLETCQLLVGKTAEESKSVCLNCAIRPCVYDRGKRYTCSHCGGTLYYEESYEKFIESLADQLNKKFLLPLLKLAFTLDTTPFQPISSPALLDDILNVPELEMPKATEQQLARPKLKVTKRIKKMYLLAHPFARS